MVSLGDLEAIFVEYENDHESYTGRQIHVLLARVRDLEAALREIHKTATSTNRYDGLAVEIAAIARAVLAGETAGEPISYTGSESSVECAYPSCRNRLRFADFGAQFCSKEHRRLAAVSSPGRSER